MSKPRILLLDIETSPDLVWTWGVYEQNAIEVLEHWKVLSFSAEWYGGKQITKGLNDYKGYKPSGTDEEICRDIWRLLNEADIVIAHNGLKFDIRKLNARFIAHGFDPPSEYKVVDTAREVRRVAAFSSNKLDWLCKQLELGHKLEHEGWPLWRACIGGDKKAWAKMKKYNRHDVTLMKKLYKLLQPWIKQPNMGAWVEGIVCTNPACGSTKLTKQGFKINKTRRYQQYKCQICGSWSRSVKSEKQSAKAVGV